MEPDFGEPLQEPQAEPQMAAADNKPKVLFDEQNIAELDQVARLNRKQNELLQKDEDEDPKTPYNEVTE